MRLPALLAIMFLVLTMFTTTGCDKRIRDVRANPAAADETAPAKPA